MCVRHVNMRSLLTLYTVLSGPGMCLHVPAGIYIHILLFTVDQVEILLQNDKHALEINNFFIKSLYMGADTPHNQACWQIDSS